MDLLWLLALIVGTNIATFLLAQFHFYSLMKQAKLLPVYLAYLNGKCKGVIIEAMIEKEYQATYKKNMDKCGGMRAT